MPIVNPSASPAIPGVTTLASVSLFSDVRALRAGQYPLVWVLGGTVVGDGQDGVFYWSSSSLTADDGLTILAPNAGGTGRWIRLYSGFSLSSGASHVSTIQSGSGAVSRSVQDKARERFTPEDNGLLGDGVTPITGAAMKQIFANAIAAGRPVDLTGKNYLISSAMSLDSSYSNLQLIGGRLTKGFNGDLLTLTNVNYFRAYGTWFEGQYGTYTGNGLVLSGSACSYPSLLDCLFEGFAGDSLLIGADAGKHGRFDFKHVIGNAQSDPRVVFVNGPDNGSAIRKFYVDCQGYLQFNGADDTYIDGQYTRIVTDSACANTFTRGNRWGNGGSAMTLSGTCQYVGNSYAGDVTLDSSFNGIFMGNIQSAGTFTDSSTATNALVLHRPAGAVYYNLAKHFLAINSTVGFEIPAFAMGSPGDADFTYSPGASVNILTYATAFTANRTLTLNTTNARNTSLVFVSRTAGDTLGPWTLALGATGTNLSTKQSALLGFTGSFWRVIMLGTTP